jgi:ribosomal protein S27AE
MSAVPGKMICPRCGAEMNHHGNKIVFGDGENARTETSDDELLEFHECPVCGTSSSRPA